jgi:HEPN domain-containing protein
MGCILARKRKKPVPDLVCFHCHQAAEKFLKGYLVGENIPFPETHDLASLDPNDDHPAASPWYTIICCLQL